MLATTDASWLVFAMAAVAIVAYVLGHVLDTMVGDDAFGTTGNMVVMTAGFFLGIFAANRLGYALHDLLIAICVGLAGAFIALWLLAFLKAGLRRAFS